jgi:hypothetical protein
VIDTVDAVVKVRDMDVADVLEVAVLEVAVLEVQVIVDTQVSILQVW